MHTQFLIDLVPSGREKKFYKAIETTYNRSRAFTARDVLHGQSEEDTRQLELLCLYAEEKLDHLPEKSRLSIISKLVFKLNEVLVIDELDRITKLLRTTQRGSDEQLLLMKQYTDFVRLRKQMQTTPLSIA